MPDPNTASERGSTPDQTSERKSMPDQTLAKAMAVVGTMVSICGYVVQFVGLRGSHWSAAVVQLGATVMMATIRAWVRRDLAKRLESQPLVSRFELDWLALTLSMEPGRAPWSNEPSDKGKRTRPWVKDVEGEEWDWEITSFQDKADNLILEEAIVPETQAHNIMRIRRELGKLGDWHGPASAEAVSLARAIEITLDTLFNHSSENLSWSLPVHHELIRFRLERLNGSWKAFADELEAALSLWLYHINNAEENDQKQPGDDKSNGTSKAHNAKDDDAWLRIGGTVDKRNLRLLGHDSPRLYQDLIWSMPDGAARVIKIKKAMSNEEYRTIEVEAIGIEECESTSTPRTIEIEKYRMVGLAAGSMPLISNDEFEFPISGQEERRILAVDSYGPLKTLLAQYMFSAFMWAAVNYMNKLIGKEPDNQDLTKKELSKKKFNKTVFSGVEIRPRDTDGEGQGSTWQSFSLHNIQLSNMAWNIHNTGLGFLEEVYFSIIPPLSKWNIFPQLDAVVNLVQERTYLRERSIFV